MNAAPEVTERLLAEFSAVVSETEQLLKSIALAGNDKGEALKAGVNQKLADAGAQLARIRDESVRHVGAAARATDDYVQGNPWRAMGIVAGVAAITGLVAGLLITRR